MDTGSAGVALADSVGHLRPPEPRPPAVDSVEPGLEALVRTSGFGASRPGARPHAHGRGPAGGGPRVGRLRHDYGPFGHLPTGLKQLLRPYDAAGTRPIRGSSRHGGADQDRQEGDLLRAVDTAEARSHAGVAGLELTRALLDPLTPAPGHPEARADQAPALLPVRREGEAGARKEASLPRRWASKASELSGFLKNTVGLGGWGRTATHNGVKKTIEKHKQPSRTKRERLAAAVLAARNSRDSVLKLEQAFTAPNSQKTKNAIRATIEAVIREAGQGRTLPATAQRLKLLAACLKEAGYKAGSNYLGEYKIMHIEGGFEWSHQLQRCWQQCRRAADRARGPRRKAKEVPTYDDGDNFTVTKAY